MLAKCLIYLVFAAITQIVTYEIMRKIDRKEREKLKKWEDHTIDELIEHRQKLKNMPKIDEKNAVETIVSEKTNDI